MISEETDAILPETTRSGEIEPILPESKVDNIPGIYYHDNTEEVQEWGCEDEERAFDVGESNGPWCSCLPDFLTMGVMTFVFALLGFACGALSFEANVQESWVRCYKGTDSLTHDNSCWLEVLAFPGKMWIRALKCLVVPLMASMMITLPEKLKDVGKVGGRLVCFLIFTSFVASMEGLFWVWLFRPGDGVTYSTDPSSLAEDNISELESFLNIFDLFVPANIIQSMQGTKILAIIAVFTAYGIEINNSPWAWRRPVLNVSKAILRSTLKLLAVLMWFTPIAMFSLISYNLARTDALWEVFEALGKYVGCQLLGQFCHLFIFYFILYFLATWKNPFAYLWSIKDAPVTAFITSSSAATMPVTIRVNQAAGNYERLVQFTIPLGAGMNMDGTSLGFPVMVIFTAQLAGIELSAASQITVAILSMVCSLGTAPVPNAGLVFLTMLYATADLSVEAQGLGYALISSVDWLIDRIETAQNVTSDSFICGVLSHYYRGQTGCLGCVMGGLLPKDNDLKQSPVSSDTYASD